MMEFRKTKTDDLTLMADLVQREASDRDPRLAAALRTIEIVEKGRYGQGRPDVHVTLALKTGLEVTIVEGWGGPHAPRSQLVEDATALAGAAERVFDDRVAAADMVREVRAALSREVAKARRRGLLYRAVHVSLTPIEANRDDLPAAMVQLEVIGPLLDLELVRFDAESADDVVRYFAEMRDTQELRVARRRRMIEMGAYALIDAPTLAVLEDGGIDPARAIADLKACDVGIIDIDVRYGQLVLYSRDGIVTGNTPVGRGMRWREGKLTAPKSAGISATRAKGKSLRRLTKCEFFDADVLVDYASEFSDIVWLNARPAPVALVPDAPLKAA